MGGVSRCMDEGHRRMRRGKSVQLVGWRSARQLARVLTVAPDGMAWSYFAVRLGEPAI